MEEEELSNFSDLLTEAKEMSKKLNIDINAALQLMILDTLYSINSSMAEQSLDEED
jgi:hypothetical protein